MIVTIEKPSSSCGTPNVNRSVPDGPSIPTMVRARPMPRAMRPLTIDSDTTLETARKAKTASAKYSAGPKTVARVVRNGIRNTVSIVASRPPMKAPMAAVARARPAFPCWARRCPSKVGAMAEDCPGVFRRIAAVESPNMLATHIMPLDEGVLIHPLVASAVFLLLPAYYAFTSHGRGHRPSVARKR